MSLSSLGLIFVCVILNVAAQLLLKAGTKVVDVAQLNWNNWFAVGWKMATQLPIVGGLTCYVVSMVVWIIVLSRTDVTTAYPMISLGYVLTAVGGWYFFGEVFTLQRLIAIAVILVGVALLARS